MKLASATSGSLLLTLLGTACLDEDRPITGVTAPKIAAAIEIVSSPAEETRVGVPWADPLVARVTDPDGVGVPGLAVTFRVPEGEAGLATVRESTSVHEISIVTNADGIARVWLTAWQLGTHTLEASVMNPAGADPAPVSFTFDASVYTITFYDDWGLCPPYIWCQDPPALPTGTVVEFLNADVVPHVIASVSVPSGATPFDSGVLMPGEAFRFVFDVPGVWQYHDPSPAGSPAIRTLTFEDVH